MQLLLVCLFLTTFLLFRQRQKLIRSNAHLAHHKRMVGYLAEDLARQEEIAYKHEMKATQLQREIAQFCKESRAARIFWKKIARRKIKSK